MDDSLQVNCVTEDTSISVPILICASEKRIAQVRGSDLFLLNKENGEVIDVLSDHTNEIVGTCASADTNVIYSCEKSGKGRNTFWIFDRDSSFFYD